MSSECKSGSCPICCEVASDLVEHLVSYHDFDREGSKKFLDLVNLFLATGLEPIKKNFKDYSFEDYLELLNASDEIFKYLDYDSVMDLVEGVMESVSKKYGEKCLESLPSLASGGPVNWKSVLAFLTILKTGREEAIPILMRLSLFSDFLEYDWEIFDFLGLFKDRAFDLVEKYGKIVRIFDYSLFFEWLADINESKAVNFFVKFFKTFPAELYRDAHNEIYDFLIFLLNLYGLDEAIDKFSQLLNILISILEFGDPDKKVDLIYYLSTLDFFDNPLVLSFNFEKINYVEPIWVDRGLDLLLDLVEAYIEHPKWYRKIREIDSREYEEMIRFLEFKILKILVLIFIGYVNIKYCNLITAEKFLIKALNLAEENNLKLMQERALHNLAHLYFIKGDSKKLFNAIKSMELIGFDGNFPLSLKMLLTISHLLDGKNEDAKKLLDEIESYELGKLTKDYIQLLRAVIYERSGDNERASNIMKKFTKGKVFDAESIFNASVAKLLIEKCCYERGYSFIKNEKALKAIILDDIMATDKIKLLQLINHIVEVEGETPLISFYLGVIKALSRDYDNAIRHFLKAMKSKVVNRSQLLKNIFCTALVSRKIELAKKVAEKITKMESYEDYYVIKSIYYAIKGEKEKAKVLAMKLKKVNRDLYRDLMRYIRGRRSPIKVCSIYTVARSVRGKKTIIIPWIYI